MQDDERPNWLEIGPEEVCQLIALARRFHAREAMSLPGDSSDAVDGGASGVLIDSPDDPVEEEIRALVGALGAVQQGELVALMWLGRGDAPLAEFPALVRQARDDLPAADVADYLLEHPLLAGYLTDGLALHGLDCGEA